MNMLDIFCVILESIKNDEPNDFESLMKSIEKTNAVENLRVAIGDEKSIEYIQDVLEDMIDQRLIVARKLVADGYRLFFIERLTPSGYEYLDKLNEEGFSSKFKSYAKKNGVSPSIENITKLIANLMWD